MINYDEMIALVKGTLVCAGSTFRSDKIEAYEKSIERETGLQAKWVLETIVENARVAGHNCSTLCDDSGIPHLFLEVGKHRAITGEMIDAIHVGVAEGLRELPGRPMGIIGNDKQRIDQSGGISDDPGAVLPAPILIKRVEDDVIRLHVIMQGGGPAIRAKTSRVFHKHSVAVVVDEIVNWASEAVSLLGCAPCTLAIGIGRSHFEATSLMMESQVYGKYGEQSPLECEITNKVNETNIGALGLSGKTSVLATFLTVGPQRASGVRIVSLRPCCCFEPRIASVEL